MEKLVAMMAFCEAPLDGTLAPSGAAGYDGASATGGGNVVALLAAAAKKYTVGRLVATMAFCEAPFDGTFDATTSPPSSGAAGGDSASATNVPGEAGGAEGAALRRAWLADAKKAETVVDGLAIFETVALQ